MTRKLRDSVVVITGASSGIGRATALAFAKHGASVVLAARREGPLREVASECERRGGRALPRPTDMTDDEAVERLVRAAVEHFGRIDVWVNNAAVTCFGRFEETPPEAFRQVIETNLFGYIRGARAALLAFREQGSGVLINVSSVAGATSQPYTSAYVTSKHGVRAFGMSLRQELSLEEGHDIHVSTVLPASIDTPIFQHGANYIGRAPKPMKPVYAAEDVARAIVSCAEHPRAEVFVGKAGKQMQAIQRISPRLGERMMARMVDEKHFEEQGTATPTAGNVFAPMMEWTSVSGGWLSPSRRFLRRTLSLGAKALPVALALLWLGPKLPALRG